MGRKPPSPPLADQPFVVVDVETTGLSPAHDRIIEVCAVRLCGGTIIEEFTTLVNPGVPLPLEITRLTGISAAMLGTAPRFAEIAQPLLTFLGSDPFVAHNAAFDYGFLREELRRVDAVYSVTTLCTAKLGRRLVAGLRRANLAALLAALDVPREVGHRAAGDALATAHAFLKLLRLAQEEGVSTLATLTRLQAGGGSNRLTDLATRIRQLPQAPGVYCFRTALGQVVYVGKANNLRRRVQSHFRPGAQEPQRLRRVLPAVDAIDHIETGSELEALLLESRLIKQYLPAGNQAQRDYHQYPYLRLNTAESFPRLSVTRTLRADGATYYGPFRRARPLEDAAAALRIRFKLPRCDGPIIPGQTPMCIYGQMGRCLAPCAGKISEADYAALIGQVQGFLRGEDGGVIHHLEERRDALAEGLRFEEAAQLRDAADELRRVFGAQHHLLAAVHECHVLLLTASTEAGAVELFAVRGGLLAAQRRLRPSECHPDELARWLQGLYVPAGEPTGACVRNDQLDELHLIASWVRREEARHLAIPVDLQQPAAAVGPLVDAVASFDLLTASQVPAAS